MAILLAPKLVPIGSRDPVYDPCAMAVTYLGGIPIPTLPEAGEDVSPTQESMEQSVASLMGEIGKHIEGQLQAAAAVEGTEGEAGSTASGEEASSKGETQAKYGVVNFVPFEADRTCS